MASLPLPHDVPPQPNKPQVTQDMPAPCHMPLEHAHEQSSPQHDSLSVSSAAAASTAASMAATKRIDDQISPSAAEIEAAGKAVDNTPIRALVKQTSDGTRVSPSIGRRSTHFSTSSEDSLLRDRQTDCAQPLEDDAASDVTQNGWHLHRDVAPHAAGGGQKHECHVGPRSYLTCCVRLSPEKEPHRSASNQSLHTGHCLGHCYSSKWSLSNKTNCLTQLLRVLWICLLKPGHPSPSCHDHEH